VVVVEFDQYTKEVEMGETARFHVAVYNNGSADVFVYITLTSTETHWEVNATPDFSELGSGEFQDIELSVTAPYTRDYPDESVTLTLNFLDLETHEGWSRSTVTTTSLVGGGVIPERKILGLFENPFQEGWMNSHWGIFVLNAVCTSVIALFLIFVFPPITHKLTRKTETKLDDMIIDIIRGPITLIFILFMCVESVKSLPLSYTMLHQLQITFDVVFVFAGAWMIYKIFKDIVIYYAKRLAEGTETELDDVLIPLAEKLGAIFIVAGAFAYILRDFGIDITLVVAGMGFFGLVVSFAMQESLSNFVSGMFLLTDRPFKTGDDIQLSNGDYCKVLHVGIRTTRLYRGITHDILVLPNSEIANKPIVNLTQPDRMIVASIKVGVAYDSDMERVRAVMLDIARGNKDVVIEGERKPFFRVSELAESAIIVTLFFYVRDLSNMWRVQSEMREAVHKRFAVERIEIPFPQKVVHLRKGEA
jgi:MscS family membrane protein